MSKTRASGPVDFTVRRIVAWTNIGLLAMLVATVGVISWPRIAEAVGLTGPPAAAAYAAGDVIDTPADWLSPRPYTLVLFAQSGCGGCQRAQPFLASLVPSVAAQADTIVVSPAGRHEAELAYGHSIGVAEDAVYQAPRTLRARVTPTLVLVDRRGTIIHAWEGLPPDRQAEIAAEIADAIR